MSCMNERSAASARVGNIFAGRACSGQRFPHAEAILQRELLHLFDRAFADAARRRVNDAQKAMESCGVNRIRK